MFVENEVSVIINPSNISHYRRFYEDIKSKDVINVKVNELTEFSNTLIKVKCDECDIEKKIMYKYYKSYGYSNGDYFCKSCKLKKNNMEKYGVKNVFQLESVKEKSKKTNMDKYGVEYITQSDDIKNIIKSNNIEKYGSYHHFKNVDILNKLKESNIDKYGVDNVSKLSEIKIKKAETCNKNHGVDCIFLDPNFITNHIQNNNQKYGVDHYFKSEIGKEKISEANIKKYGVDNPSKNKSIGNKIKNSVIKTLHDRIYKSDDNIKNIDSENRMFDIFCEDCNEIFRISYFLFYKRRETNTHICTKCNPIDKHQSGLEIQLRLFIENNYDGIIENNFKLDGKELDIYLPELKLAFEFNGVYWHSEVFKEKNFHKVKTDLCNKSNIQLIHIWEDDWLYKKDIIKSMILNKLGKTQNKIFARKCEIREVNDINLIKDFLNNNHIQGFVVSTIKIGLFYNNELVSLMCFKKNNNQYELNRFCSLLNYNIIGSSSKLFKYFLSRYKGDIFTFSDNTYSDGSIYKSLNFSIKDILKPDYKYVVNGVRIHKFNFRKKNTDGIYRIYDAGKVKWIYSI